ncbi:MAG: flagellar biosynthesis protein FlhA [Chthonomonas sp.]|nr:flagellar biosynthesis protein FlhA [Chthonomonas sp.]
MQLLNRILRQTDLMLGAALMLMIAMLIIPLPHWVLDLGLVVSMAAAVIILLASVNVDDPLKFSVFPSMLLLTTLQRLALSFAATKLILGTGEAGHVIETFGNLVMGGDFFVGFVAFCILMIVQFIVITNGAGRVSEVTARFTLDAMPGKQMAIDADLAAGLIDEVEAKERRKAVKREADFYGAMDGASKFVKGDAIASVLIIIVNIIGGFVVGFMRGEGDALTILQTYALLSVGEGLVSQIPALLISTASGLLVTRAGQERHMGSELLSQLLGQPRALMAAGFTLCTFAFIPGFPAFIFLGAGGGLLALSRLANQHGAAITKQLAPKEEPQTARQLAAAAAVAGNPGAPETIMPLLGVDALEFEVGYGITRLADPKSGGDLPDRVTATRRQVATELGFVMPSVRIRDSVALSANEYVIKVRGEEIARATIDPDRLLAIGSGGVALIGQPCQEPVFGLDALWIDAGLRDQAEIEGYTVVEPTAMMATHLSEVVKSHAAELLSRQDVMNLVENAKAHNAAVVEELIPSQMTVGDVQKVLQHLLRERVPVRDMVTILETLADFASRVKDPDQLGELVRAAINRTITRQVIDQDNRLYCLTLEPALERALQEALQQTSMGAVLALDPVEQQRVLDQLREESDRAVAQGMNPVLLCNTNLRLPLSRVVSRYLPTLSVLAYNEVAARADVEIIGAVKALAA